MDLTTLQRRFGRPGVVTFDQQSLIRVNVRTAAATASIYLQGAHLAAWQPAGFEPVIFLSRKTELAAGKPIRGGVPIVFPWFATDSKRDRIDGHPGPSHGFARIQEWTMTAAEPAGDAMLLRFELGPTEMSRAMGFDHFRLTQEFRIGRELTMQLTVKNESEQPLTFEEAFHSYYNVTDVHEVTLDGLEPTGYIDKTDSFNAKPPSHEPLHFTNTTDRVYNDTTATCTIHDGAGQLRIVVRKTGSNTTVVWTPFKELPDLGPWEWHEMLAVETANVGTNSVTLATGASSIMAVHVSVAKEPVAKAQH